MMKLAKVDSKRNYELTYLLPSDKTEKDLQTSQEAVAAIVTKHKGKIGETFNWGKRQLAYKIKKGSVHNEASFTHLLVEFPAERVHEFERELLLSSEVIRHLLVRAESTEKTEKKVLDKDDASEESKTKKVTKEKQKPEKK